MQCFVQSWLWVLFHLCHLGEESPKTGRSQRDTPTAPWKLHKKLRGCEIFKWSARSIRKSSPVHGLCRGHKGHLDHKLLGLLINFMLKPGWTCYLFVYKHRLHSSFWCSNCYFVDLDFLADRNRIPIRIIREIWGWNLWAPPKTS